MKISPFQAASKAFQVDFFSPRKVVQIREIVDCLNFLIADNISHLSFNS